MRSPARRRVQADFDSPWMEALELYFVAFERGVRLGALQEAREALLDNIDIRFQRVPQALRERIARIDDLELLRSLRRRAVGVSSLEEFEQECTAAYPVH